METLDPSFPTETKPWSSMNEYHLWALKKLSYVFSSVSYKQLNSGKATTHASGLEECRSYPKTWSKQYFGQSYQNNQSTRSTLSSAVTQAPSPHWTWCVCVVIIPRAAKLVHHSSYFWEGYHDSSTCARKRKRGENEGKTLLTKRGKRCKKHLLFGEHSKKIQSLLSRLPVKIQLPSQPRLGLNFIFFSLLRGKIDKRPSSKCVWGKHFQPGGLPPPPSFPGRSQSGSNSQAPLPTPTEFYTA